MGDIEALRVQFASETDPQRRVVIVKALGELFLERGNSVDARKAFESAAQFDARDVVAVRGVRRSLVAAGAHSDALAWFQKELALLNGDGERARLFKALGDHFQNQLSDLDNAQKAFARARQLDPLVFEPVVEAPVVEAVVAPPPVAPVEPASAAAPAPGPVPHSRPSRVPVAKPPPAPARSSRLVWVAVAAIAVVGVVWGAVGRSGAAHSTELELPCAGTLTRLQDLMPAEGLTSQYECVNRLTARRWKIREGRIVEMVELADGKLEGAAVETPDALQRIEGAYAGGLKTGTWRTFDRGVLISEDEWIAGLRQGRSRRFLVDGGVAEQTDWKRDRRNGEYVVFDENGRRRTEGEYKDDGRIGRWVSYDARGLIEDQWKEPRAVDAGIALGATLTPIEELYAGQTLGWWRIRVAELRVAAKSRPEILPVYELALHRAELAGLSFNRTTNQLEVTP